MPHPRVQERGQEEDSSPAVLADTQQLLEEQTTVYAEALPLGHSQAAVSTNPPVVAATRLSTTASDDPDTMSYKDQALDYLEVVRPARVTEAVPSRQVVPQPVPGSRQPPPPPPYTQPPPPPQQQQSTPPTHRSQKTTTVGPSDSSGGGAAATISSSNGPEKPWYEKYKRHFLIGGGILAVVIVVVAVVTATGGGGGEDPQPTRSFASDSELFMAVNQYLSVDGVTAVEKSYGPISAWDVSWVTVFDGLFDATGRTGAAAAFNADISAWDTSQATSMQNMFRGAVAFNQDISGWSVSRVTSFDSMFAGATSFNQDISGWSISNSATSIESMFNGATSFSQDLCGWGSLLNSATIVDGAFASTACPLTQDPDFTESPPSPFWNACVAPPTTQSPTKAPSILNAPTLAPLTCPDSGRCFTSLPELRRAVDNYLADPTGRETCEEYGHPINNWCVSNVIDFALLFTNERGTFNEPIGDWDMSGAVSLLGMFENNYVFNQ
eukprot:scaffold3136_cov161-Amphora_coffeaeformis.AAC.6